MLRALTPIVCQMPRRRYADVRQQAITSEHFELSAKKFVDAYRIALRKVNLYRGAFVLLSILHFEESSHFKKTYMARELDNYLKQIDDIYQTLIYYP